MLWFWKALNRIKTVWGWLGFFWQIIVGLGFAGFFISLGVAVWAALIGVPLPIVIMAGYCTFVGAVYLVMAPFLFRVVSQAGIVETTKVDEEPKPHYEAWRHVHKLTLRQAAFLWCDMEPGASMSDRVRAWFNALRSAIQKGELGFELSPGSGSVSERRTYQKDNPNLDTIVTRDQLKAYAREIDEAPLFLQDQP